MWHSLHRHPDTNCEAVVAISCAVSRQNTGTLNLHYRATGAIDDARLPPFVPPMRADGLWRHSCFEVFIRASAGAAYYEFNFAPSRQWAAYRFESRRSGMADVPIDPPAIETTTSIDRFALHTSLELDCLPDLSNTAAWTIGLSAVIEETNGRRSYWALDHPAGGADFHHSDCFALELPAPKRA